MNVEESTYIDRIAVECRSGNSTVLTYAQKQSSMFVTDQKWLKDIFQISLTFLSIAPEYIILISDIAGEQRFASTVAKRLESLPKFSSLLALTHGDRRATESNDLIQFNIDNKYGQVALQLSLIHI